MTRALLSLAGDLEGEYSSLSPCGMSAEREQTLRKHNLMLEEPDAPILISAGLARDWPEGRGVFVNRDFTVAAWVNGVEHLQLMSRLEGGDVRNAFDLFVRTEHAVGSALKAEGYEFATHPQLGFVNASLSCIGSALQVAITLLLPHLSLHDDFRHLCKKLGVTARRATHSARDSWEITNIQRLGCSEVAQVNMVIEAARILIKIERHLGSGALQETLLDDQFLSTMSIPDNAEPPGSSEPQEQCSRPAAGRGIADERRNMPSFATLRDVQLLRTLPLHALP